MAAKTRSTPAMAVTLVCVVALVAVVFRLVLNSHFGIANNGDFPRVLKPYVLHPYGLPGEWNSPDYWDQVFWYWVPRRHGSVADFLSAFLRAEALPSSAHLVWAASYLAALLSDHRVFDIRTNGAVCCAAVAAGLAGQSAALVRAARLPPAGPLRGLHLAIGAGMLVCAGAVFSDHAVVRIFNSFYQETAGILGLFLLAAAFGVMFAAGYAPGDRSALVGYVLASAGALVLVGAKAQHFWSAAPLSVALAALASVHPAVRPRHVLPSVVLLIAASLVMLQFGVSREARATNAFHSLFMGVLVYSDDPAAHLRAAGLPREGLSSIGREAWFEPEASYLRDNAAGMTHRNTLRAILAEPAALARMALDAAEHVGAVQEAWLGSEPAYRVAGQSAAAAGRAGGGEASPRPSFWALLPRGASYFAVCAAVWALSALVFLRSRREAALRPLATLAVAAWLFATLSVGELLVCILGEGMAAIAKHLFVSSLSFALAAASGTGLAVGYCASFLAGPGARRCGG